MPTPDQFKAPLHPQRYYHAIFRSVDDVLLFRIVDNRDFFLKRFSNYLHPVCNCLAYCLLDNHAHFIIQVKSSVSLKASILSTSEEFRTVSMKKFLEEPDRDEIVDEMLERQVNRFMVSYANAFNKAFSRRGTLFQSPFRRVEIKEDAHLQQAIIYVHANAQKHGLIKDFKDYQYSSYWEIMYDNSMNVQVNDVLQFFDNKERFKTIHQQQIDHYYKRDWPSSKLE
jgi:putative transposase